MPEKVLLFQIDNLLALPYNIDKSCRKQTKRSIFMEHTGEYYLISHLTLFTGLTDRTIRSHIAAGFLQGEKINGLWLFTPEQVDRFLRHPAVRPSILAKNNSIIYDFLADGKKQEASGCLILDIPGEDTKKCAEYFCYEIANGNFRNLRFSMDAIGGTPRIILRGPVEQILPLVTCYFDK